MNEIYNFKDFFFIDFQSYRCDGELPCDNVLTIPIDCDAFMVKCIECDKFTNILKGLKAMQVSSSRFCIERFIHFMRTKRRCHYTEVDFSIFEKSTTFRLDCEHFCGPTEDQSYLYFL